MINVGVLGLLRHCGHTLTESAMHLTLICGKIMFASVPLESVGCVFVLCRSVYIDLVLSGEPLGLSLEQGDTINVNFVA